MRSASEGKRRWQEIETLFEIEYPMFWDAVSIIEPTFQLVPAEETTARDANVPCLRNVDNRIAVWFLKWERCPLTRGIPNPYEPWIEIWEHGEIGRASCREGVWGGRVACALRGK